MFKHSKPTKRVQNSGINPTKQVKNLVDRKFFIKLIIFVALLGLLFFGIYAPLNSQLKKSKVQNNQLKSQIDELNEEIRSKESDLQDKDREINDLKDKITFLPDNLLSLTNAKRIEAGLSPLQLNKKLNESAKLKAEDMLSKSYWAHDAPDGTEPWYFFDKVRYSYSSAGENLAFGYLTGDAMVTGWMNSLEHKKNILDPKYKEVGFNTIFISELNSKFNRHLTVAHYGSL